MRGVLIFALLVGSPAFAQQQQQQQTIEELRAQYLFENGQLRQALGQSQAHIIQLRKENAELKDKARAEKPPEGKK